eukprot:6116728-Pyramimonas_sp.AAC.1
MDAKRVVGYCSLTVNIGARQAHDADNSAWGQRSTRDNMRAFTISASLLRLAPLANLVHGPVRHAVDAL